MHIPREGAWIEEGLSVPCSFILTFEVCLIVSHGHMDVCRALDPTGPMNVGSVMPLTLAFKNQTIELQLQGQALLLAWGFHAPGIVEQGRDSS